MNEVVLKKCKKCGAVVSVINDCKCKDCGIMCCNEKMVLMKPKKEEGNIHMPLLKRKDRKIFVTMSHEMTKDHYIKYIIIINDDGTHVYEHKPGDEIAFVTQYNGPMKVYAYCNKHELWLSEI